MSAVICCLLVSLLCLSCVSLALAGILTALVAGLLQNPGSLGPSLPEESGSLNAQVEDEQRQLVNSFRLVVLVLAWILTVASAGTTLYLWRRSRQQRKGSGGRSYRYGTL
jgi:hypothetical protein